MAQVNAGRVRFVSRGEYNNTTQYYLFDLVNYEGSSYVAIGNTLGNLPTNTTYWQLVAEKGNTGSVGPEGPQGVGIASITKTGTVGLVDTYTIAYTNGTTTTFTVTNGEDGEVTQAQLDETNREVDYYKSTLNALPKVEGEGTTLTLDDTAEAPMKMSLAPSELEQLEQGSPSPEFPQEIHTISGDNEIAISNDYVPYQEQTLPLNLPVENLWNPNQTLEIGQYNNGVWQPGANNRVTGEFIETKKNDKWTIFVDLDNLQDVALINYNLFDSNKNWLGARSDNGDTAFGGEKSHSFTINMSNVAYMRVTFRRYSTADTSLPIANVQNSIIQLEPGLKINSYTPYGTPALEYCKIGDYEDEFVYNTIDTSLEIGKWYLKKNIGKVVLDGSEIDWQMTGISTFFNSNTAYFARKYLVQNALSNYYKNIVDTNIINNNTANTILKNGEFTFRAGDAKDRIYIKNTDYSDVNTFKNWLSTHNIEVYYVLATPEYIPLNNTLQSQLTEIYKWVKAYQEQTNISQVNNDLPFVIKASAVYDLNKLMTRVEVLESEM